MPIWPASMQRKTQCFTEGRATIPRQQTPHDCPDGGDACGKASVAQNGQLSAPPGLV